MRFCEYIEQRMKELHMKPIDLATLTGFDKSYISVILHGKQNPTKEETIQTLARVLRLKNWMWLLVYAIRDKDPSLYFNQDIQDSDSELTAFMERLTKLSASQRQAAIKVCESAMSVMQQTDYSDDPAKVRDAVSRKVSELIQENRIAEASQLMNIFLPEFNKKVGEEFLKSGGYLSATLFPTIGAALSPLPSLL